MKPSGKFFQSLNDRTLAAEGSELVLSKDPGRKLTAIKMDDQRTISRLLPEDGLDAGNKTPVVFLLSGGLYDASGSAGSRCLLKHDDEFFFAGVRFTLESLHPTLNAGTCTELLILAY